MTDLRDRCVREDDVKRCDRGRVRVSLYMSVLAKSEPNEVCTRSEIRPYLGNFLRMSMIDLSELSVYIAYCYQC